MIVAIATASVALSVGLGAVQMSGLAILSIADDMSRFLQIAAPVAFVSLATLVVPLLPRSARVLGRDREDTRLTFGAIRSSARDESWIADKLRGSMTRLRRSAEYPFVEPYAYRLTCWRGILFNTGADPVLDVTVTNRSAAAFLIARIGIEMLSVGSITERRDPFFAAQPVRRELEDCFAIQMPDTLTLFKHARAENADRDLLAIDIDHAQVTDLGEPYYLRPTKSFRFDLQLLGFCENTPLHALARVVLHTDGGVFHSPVIYFRR